MRPQEGKAETGKGEALVDYSVGQLEDAPAASGEQRCAGLQHSTGVALELGAEKGKRAEHPLGGGYETQRARGREGQVVFCLMLDTFLLLTAAYLASALSYPEQSLIPNAAFQQGLSSLGNLDVWSPCSTWGEQDSSSNSFVSSCSLTSACLLTCNRRNSTAPAEVVRQHLSNFHTQAIIGLFIWKLKEVTQQKRIQAETARSFAWELDIQQERKNT